jgi:hypothetical protein
MIYGSDAETAAGLRTFSGGKLKTSDGDLLPTDANGYFLAGDGRVNENIELTALQTLFMREHNLWADRIAKANPLFTDEQIYQNARAIVGAEIQVITYKEFLPALLGPNALSRYKGYDPTVNPNIATEFSSAGFRLGHSLLNDEVEFFDNDSQPVHDEILLREAFGNPALIKETGIDPLLKYLASVKSEELDIRIVDSLRNFLSDPPAVLDLAAVNIQRGRDVGLADYNSTREAYGLKAVRKFSDITSDKEVQSQLRQLYGSVDNIDLWVGALAEDHVPGGSVGPLLRAILTDQFERLRDGDRLWYQKIFSGRTLSLLEDTSLADIIKRNSTVNNVQDNAFLLKVSISGQVLLSSSSKAFDIGFNNDFFGDRFPNPFTQPIGLARVAVELLNDEGEVVARTVTDRSGRYSFVNMLRETGNYQVRIIVPNGLQIDDNYIDMSITTGDMIYRGLNFLLSRSRGGDAK